MSLKRFGEVLFNAGLFVALFCYFAQDVGLASGSNVAVNAVIVCATLLGLGVGAPMWIGGWLHRRVRDRRSARP